MKFRVLSLTTGRKYDFKVRQDKQKVQICSVARGRADVTIDGMRFRIGEGGMWRVRGCEKCTVQNELNEDLFVHISSVF